MGKTSIGDGAASINGSLLIRPLGGEVLFQSFFFFCCFLFLFGWPPAQPTIPAAGGGSFLVLYSAADATVYSAQVGGNFRLADFLVAMRAFDAGNYLSGLSPWRVQFVPVCCFRPHHRPPTCKPKDSFTFRFTEGIASTSGCWHTGRMLSRILSGYLTLVALSVGAADIPKDYQATANRLIHSATNSTFGFNRLATLCVTFGPRLSGSANL